jgi:8-oxo-dGTP diphosphatase
VTTLASAAIVEWQGKVLIGKKKDVEHPLDLGGTWHLPGGRLNANETFEQAIVREMKEEADIEVVPRQVLGIAISEKTDHQVVWFRCEAKQGDIKAGDDLAEVRWVSKSDCIALCDPKAKILWTPEVKQYLGISE